jgi:ribonuclease Y
MGLILLTIIGLIVGLTIGYFVSKSQHEKSIDGAKNTASGIIEQAKKEAETLQKEYLLDSKEQNHNYRLEIESELKE